MQISPAIKEYLFLSIPLFLFRSHFLNRKLSPKRIVIFTIAFNNIETIKLQAKYFSQNIKDNYQYIIGDNSTRIDISNEIEAYCQNSKIGYVRILHNPYNGVDASKSHGLAVNWMYKHIISPSNAEYFGVVDHDIFPTKRTSVIAHLKQVGVFGHVQVRGERWYLWPGFSFFNRNILGKKRYNFLPISGLDTGGGNWDPIYRYIDKSKLDKPKHYYIKYRDGDVVQNTSMEKIGDWLHLMNASGWKDGEVKTNISRLIQNIIDNDKKNKS